MGSGAIKGLHIAGIANYEQAEEACVEMRRLTAASGASYGVGDLVCFLCLAGSREGIAAYHLPDAAPPVSVDADLGTHAMSRMQKPSRQLSSTQPLVRMKCNRKSTHNVTMYSIWAFVLSKFVDWFDIGETVILCQCCRAFHGDGVYVKLRAEMSKLNISSLAKRLIQHK